MPGTDELREALLGAQRCSEAGDREGEIAQLRIALAIRADLAPAQARAGELLLEAGDAAAAMPHLRAATELRPEDAWAWLHLGSAWLAQGRLVRAREALQRAVDLEPARAAAWSRLASSMLHLGALAPALAAMARAEDLAPPDAAQIGSSRLVALHYDGSLTREQIFREHVRWAQRHMPSSPAVAFGNDRSADRMLHVAYVSPRFASQTLASLLEPVFCHDPASVRVSCYGTFPGGAPQEGFFARRGVAFVDASALDDASLARRMRDDAIDIAVDLAGHAPGNRLRAFALDPAPVTVTWLDYFDTTGVPGMRYLVSDALHSPPGDGQRFSEEVWRLPRLRFSYLPPADAPVPRTSPFARGDGPLMLGSFNRMAKISARTRQAWRRVLDALPGARLVIKNASLEHAEERDAIAGLLAADGIDRARVELRGFSPYRQMLDEYNGIDIVLDTFPYNGGVTTFEALWMGKPVLTIAGDTMVSRQSAAILQALGLESWVARDDEDLARIAARVAGELAAGRGPADDLRSRFAQRGIPDAAAVARSLEAAYRAMWRRYLEGAPSHGSR